MLSPVTLRLIQKYIYTSFLSTEVFIDRLNFTFEMMRQFRHASNGAASVDPQKLVNEMQKLFGKHAGYRTSMSFSEPNIYITNHFKLTPRDFL